MSTAPNALVLASASPRRRDLMRHLGLPFAVAVSGVDEEVEPALAPDALVALLAERKARAVADESPRGLVVGADTVVALDGDILGKPIDMGDARRMLRRLRGRAHRVWTGVAVVDAATGRMERSTVSSDVAMRATSDAEIDAYVATGEPLDKAGAYAIQGGAGLFVARIEGCYASVVGLPLCELAALLARFAVQITPRGPVCLLPDGTPCPRLERLPSFPLSRGRERGRG